MTAIWTMARKELRVLLRDPRAAVLLLGMPLLFILILGLLLGEGFGQNPDRRLRVSLVDLDEGLTFEDGAAWLAVTPDVGPLPGGFAPQEMTALTLASAHRLSRFPPGKWSEVVLRDLQETSGIRVELIPDQETARRLCHDSKRAAVLVLGPNFSRRVQRCSFLVDGINPFFRDGVKLEEVDAELIRDDTQKTGASVIEQIGQVSLLRVVLPWMIGKAFEKISDAEFIERLGNAVRLPVPEGDNLLEQRLIDFKFRRKGVPIVDGKVTLNELLKVSSATPAVEADYRRKVGQGVQAALTGQFSKYNLTGKTWATLTRSSSEVPDEERVAEITSYRDDDARYQILVPSYTVMFAFALTLVVGWLFVSERRRGTLKRLKAAPVTRSQVLLGKFFPCLALAVVQGLFLLLAGKLVFGMHWGPSSWPLALQVLWLLPVVVTTALAAMGLSMLLAAAARTEMQVAIYGALVVLALGLVSGCVVPRELMSKQAQEISLVTPHAWALNAYRQLLLSPDPDLTMVVCSCLVLTGFGLAFLGLAWWRLELE